MVSVLVCAASKHGATHEIATALAAGLQAEGLEVTRAEPAEVTRLDGIDAVVLGSGVYAGHWLEDAKDLVDRLGSELTARPVWLFSSGPIGDPPKPEDEPADVAGLRERTGALDHRVFPGRLDRSGLSRGERAVAKLVRAPEGDFRDWDAVAVWSREIAARLQAQTSAP